MPSERDGQERGQCNADDRATVPRSGHAHGQTLVREWVRAACEGQRDGKACARDAEQEPDADHLREALPGLPRPGQWNRSQQHAGEPNPSGPVLVRQHSDPDPKERSPEQELPAEEFDVPLSVQPGEQADDSHDTSLVPYDPLQRYLAEVRKYPFLSKEEELQLFHDYRTTGNREAAVKLILSNLRISVAIAAEYLHSGADYMDLIQEGNVVLMQAIRKFDTTKGVRFHSYAAWWVRAYVLRYLLNTYRLGKIGTTQDPPKVFYNLNKEKRKLEREGFVPDTN